MRFYTSYTKQILLVVLLIYCTKATAQKIVIGFYNCENFYDTTDQANTIDEDFLPTSSKQYNSEKFKRKASNIAKVVYGIGNIGGQNRLAFIGFAEIENKNVIINIASDSLLKKYHYKIIHFDANDPRGIDVGFMYNPDFFTPIQYRPFSITIKEHANDYPTRDILFVKGLLGDEVVNVLINHWPSRRGNSKTAKLRRFWASEICKQIIDSIHQTCPSEKFIVMGDFNDNPTDKSLENIPLYNPFKPLFKSGQGSIAYKDAWNLFDQILISPSLMEEKSYLTYYNSIIYKNIDLTEHTGRYRGYPKRTWNGDDFNNGFSDHFPVAVIFSLKLAQNPLK